MSDYLKGLKLILGLAVFITLIACQTVPVDSNQTSDYEQQLIFPDSTDNFTFLGRHVHEHPSLGASLRYYFKYFYFPDDTLNIHVYPINLTSWKNKNKILRYEYEKIMQEVDYAIDAGYYLAAANISSPQIHKIVSNNKELEGIKGSIKLTDPKGMNFYSYTYVFIQEDKFIKFRLNLRAKNRIYYLDPDGFVEETLPMIQVPEESPWMHKLRYLANKNGKESFSIPALKPLNQNKVAGAVNY